MGYLGVSPDDDEAQAWAYLGGKPPDIHPHGTILYSDGSGPPRLIHTAPDLQLAAPTAWEGVGQAIGQGVAGAGDSITNTLIDVGGAIAQRLPTGIEHALEWTPFQTEPDWQKSVSQGRENLEKWINSDKQYQGFAAQTAGGAAKDLAEFAPALLSGGTLAPFFGGALVGGASADDTYRDLTAQGVDDTTAKEAALGQGVVGAAGAMLPFKFGSVATKIIGGAGLNVGLGVAGRASNWAVLKANGYDDMAAMQRPLDRQSVIAELIVGAGMGLGAHFIEGPNGKTLPLEERPAPSDVDAARVTADQARAADAAPGIPTDPAAAALHQQVFDRVVDDFTNGREPQVSPDEARALTANIVDNPSHLAMLRQMHEWAGSYPEVQTAETLGRILDEAQSRLDAREPSYAPEAFSEDLTPVERAENEDFQRFFDGSKVVDAQGNPQTLYHGTAGDFSEFDNARLGESTGHMTAPLGHFLAEDRAKAQGYAENASHGVPAEERVIAAHAAIRQPKEMSLQDLMGIDSHDGARALKAKLERQGYDGIHIPEIGQWVAFDAKQIRATNGKVRAAMPKSRAENGERESLAGKTSPDEVDDAGMRQLEATHGNTLVEQEDGTVKTVREMAQQMRENVANAENGNRLMAAAVACFARNGVPF